MKNPSLERRWIQVAGLATPPAVQAVRDEIDRVTHAEVLPDCSRIILYGQSDDGKPIGPVIGAIDFIPAVKQRVDIQAEAAQDRLEAAETRAAGGTDRARGDTIIRPIDLNNPADQEALRGPRIVYSADDEPERVDLPGAEAARARPKLEPRPPVIDRSAAAAARSIRRIEIMVGATLLAGAAFALFH